MYFRFGTYTHSDNEIDLTSITIRRMYSPRNRAVFDRKTLLCVGHFCEDGQDDLKDAISSLEAAYFEDYKDAGLYHDDGTRSAHFLDNSSSINGVRVVNMSYPRGGAGEYATGRTYAITLQADYWNVEDQIYSFHQVVQYTGDTGPHWEYVTNWITPPTRVVSSLFTPQRILQYGEAVGIEGWPAVVAPIIAGPDNLRHGDLDMIQFESARKIGRLKTMLFPVKWRYVFSKLDNTVIRPFYDYPTKQGV